MVQITEEIPEAAKRLKHQVIESSQTTGHQHKIKEKRSCRLYVLANENYLEVTAEQASLVHPEHDTIELQKGIYRVWRQREFTDRGWTTMVD